MHILNTVLCTSQLKFGEVILDRLFILLLNIVGIKVYMFPGFNINKTLWAVAEIKIYLSFFIESVKKDYFVLVIF